MATLPSYSEPQEVGSSSSGPPSTNSAATKRKRPRVTNEPRDPAAKRVKTAAKRLKPPMAGKNRRSPMVTRTPMVTRSPIMRLVVSPVLVGTRSPAHSPRNSPALPPFIEERSPSPNESPPPTVFDEETRLNPGSTSTENRPRKLKSAIWNDMDPVYQDGKVIQAWCKHCYEVFPAARKSGNSHMRRHLCVCEPKLRMLEMVEKLQSSVLSADTTILTNWKFDRTITRCELVRLVVLHELPFSFVEYDGFRSYSLSLNPLAESVSRTTIKENCMQAYKNHRSSLRDWFGDCKCRFSLTADLWTSNQTTGYMVITCHFIDADWKVQKRIITFCEVKTPHDGLIPTARRTPATPAWKNVIIQGCGGPRISTPPREGSVARRVIKYPM